MKFELDANFLLAFLLIQIIQGAFQSYNTRIIAKNVNEIQAAIDKGVEDAQEQICRMDSREGK